MKRLRWQEWDRTHDGVLEWTRWDVADTWFLTVVREKGSVIWQWMADYAPDDAPAVEHQSWALTRSRAMAQAKAWAEKHDRRMRGG